MDYAIEVKNLTKIFMKNDKPTTLLSRLFPKQVVSGGVKNISFRIKEGEFVGYVGANGSGKSTTLKTLCGIISPDSGYVRCLGMDPHDDRIKYTKEIGVVFGKKGLLWPDLPVMDSLLLYKDIYEVSDEDFKERIDYYKRILDIERLLNLSARKLSFGESMRCEVVAALLHRPKILLLDEPTVGMDVVAKEQIREFLREINRKEKTTIILTTHDMGDIEALCKRIILIDNSKSSLGKIIYDGALDKLKNRYMNTKKITVKYSSIKNKKLAKSGLGKVRILKEDEGFMEMSVDTRKHDISKVVSDIMKSVDVVDLSVEDEELSSIIAKIYKEGRVV